MANEMNNGSDPRFGAGQGPASNPQVTGQQVFQPAAPQPVQGAQSAPMGAPVAPQQTPPNGTQGGSPTDDGGKPKRRGPIVVAIVCIVVVLAACICAWVFLGGGNQFFDSNAQEGQAPYKTQEEIIAELNRIVEEGMLNISIASVIEFEDGTSQGTAYIENVPSNRYVLRVTISLDSNGEVVYQSGGLRPDSYIEFITLNTDLPAGTYPATATFVAYDPDSLEEVGQAAAKVTLIVDN